MALQYDINKIFAELEQQAGRKEQWSTTQLLKRINL